jgi:hypothetical protein
MRRFLNVVYMWCVERTPPDKLEQWKFELNAPLPSKAKRTKTDETDREADMELFMAAMQRG